MVKLNPVPDEPIVTVQRDQDTNATIYNLYIPGHAGRQMFQDLNDLIEYLRSKNSNHCYIIDAMQCYQLSWGPMLPPWEGPEVK